MTDEPENRKHGVGYWWCWAVLAIVLYVGSVGPAICIVEFTNAPRWVLWIYWPFEVCPPLSNLVWPYILWCKRLMDELTP